MSELIKVLKGPQWMLCGKVTVGRQKQQVGTSQGGHAVAQVRNNYNLDQGSGNSGDSRYVLEVLLAVELDIAYEEKGRIEDTS